MKGIVVGLSVVVVAAAGLWAGQRRLVYFPSGAPPPPPADVEAVRYTTSDGLDLGGWFLSADEPIGAVLVLPGNAGNRAGRLALGRGFVADGWSVLLVDYRGYGGNPGSPTEEGLARDAEAALAHLRARPDIPSDRIVYFGESLGAGVAVGLSRTHPPAALVLRSPFASLPAVAGVHYPFVPELLVRDRYPNVETIGSVDAPVLVIAGSADEIVPVEQSRSVFDAAPDPKEFVVVDGARHNDAVLLAGPDVVHRTLRFLSDHGG